jgi:hypothetical protein
MAIIPFPTLHDSRHGTVCVMNNSDGGFDVAHESASGNSWGGFLGPFSSGEEAITVAYALNRDAYDGQCNVFVCDAALQDANPGVGLPSIPGDF